MSVKWPESATLCERCTPYFPLLIDISASSKPGKARDEWWKATYAKVEPWIIQGILDEKCELCRILRNKFSRYSGFDAANTKIKVSAHGLSTYKKLEHHTCMFQACGNSLALAPVMPVVMDEDGELIHAFAGRPVFQSFTPLLAKVWMAKCQLQHPACKPSHSPKDFDFPFRVIDVQEGRLIDAPPDVRYVALSYVWGGIKQVMLKKSNKKFLEQPGSLTPEGLAEAVREYAHVKEEVEAEGRIVPRTIREAIQLCLLINERYLWIDSLCIIQDDEIQMETGAWTNTDKLAQIPKMDIIYGASALTVIAACGPDSNAGLPGVHASSTRTAQTMGKIGDQFFVSVEYDPMEAFWRSIWVSRAWTFQEFLLSRRHLIFLPDQVVFHCRTGAWCEDHPLEYIDVAVTRTGSVPAWTHSWQLRPLKVPERSDSAEDLFSPAIFINNSYSEWLQNFLKRRLTVSSDILFAFEGALSASNRLVGTFYHGLPVGYFCESLNWMVGEAPMGGPRGHYQGLTQRRPGFPSWSWTGWMWDLPRYETFNLNYQTSSPKNWCRVGIWGIRASEDSDLESWQITIPDVKGWDRLSMFPDGAFNIDDDWIHDDLPKYFNTTKTMEIPSNYLIIKTVIATIFISSQPLNQYSNLNRAYPSTDFTVEQSLGGIGLSSEWKEKIEAGLQLQVIVVGNFFRGPDLKFPDQTDEDDPTIMCVVVQPVSEGIFERLNVLRGNASAMRRLEWRPVVAVLQ